MLRAIFTLDLNLRDQLIASLWLERNKTEISEDFVIYQKQDWLLMFSRENDIDICLPIILELWNPDILYIPHLWRSVDMIHEIGDVILPNVFLSYTVDDAPIPENASEDDEFDPHIGEARFLSTYNEQKDYYVEDYGLSIGGIIVDMTPADPHINTELMTRYEWDLYVPASLSHAYDVAAGDQIPTVIIGAIIEWKVNKHMDGTPIQQATRNMLTTIRLMEEMV